MQEQNKSYKGEYQRRKDRDNELNTRVTVKVPNNLYEDFIAKVELENTTKSAKIKELISNYTYGDES